MFSIAEIKKKADGIAFDEVLDIRDELLGRSSELIDIKDVKVQGKVSYEDGLYLLNYQLSYEITLPSSRSMDPVALQMDMAVLEPFVEAGNLSENQDLIQDDLVLILEGQTIDLRESVMDNILLNIPLRVLSPEEEAEDLLPSGQDWSVLSQEQYQALQESKKQANNPFAALDGLFE